MQLRLFLSKKINTYTLASGQSVLVMATLTEFTNLAEISVSQTDKQNPTNSTDPCGDSLDNSTGNSSYGKRYTKVSKKSSLFSNDDTAALERNTSDVQGTTISFRNIKYSVETKVKRKKVAKIIVKGIR
jgi:hypothetical protein